MEFSSSLTIFSSQTPFLLEKRIKLLEEINNVGSISKAAKNVPISYKAAWDAIDSINNLCPEPVVIKETGGIGGGGAKLTPYGKNLIKTYKIVQKEHEKFLNTLTNLTDFNKGTLKSLGRINMQLSARNQIQGEIEKLEKNEVNTNIHIKLKSGFTLYAVITNSAVENLDLKEKDNITSIFKSQSVQIVSEECENCFKGTITNIIEGNEKSEVTIEIGNGDQITSIVTSQNAKDLKIGDITKMLVKASDIVIGK